VLELNSVKLVAWKIDGSKERTTGEVKFRSLQRFWDGCNQASSWAKDAWIDGLLSLPLQCSQKQTSSCIRAPCAQVMPLPCAQAVTFPFPCAVENAVRPIAP
jgi:hypothetical protein